MHSSTTHVILCAYTSSLCDSSVISREYGVTAVKYSVAETFPLLSQQQRQQSSFGTQWSASVLFLYSGCCCCSVVCVVWWYTIVETWCGGRAVHLRTSPTSEISTYPTQFTTMDHTFGRRVCGFADLQRHSSFVCAWTLFVRLCECNSHRHFSAMTNVNDILFCITCTHNGMFLKYAHVRITTLCVSVWLCVCLSLSLSLNYSSARNATNATQLQLAVVHLRIMSDESCTTRTTCVQRAFRRALSKRQLDSRQIACRRLANKNKCTTYFRSSGYYLA